MLGKDNMFNPVWVFEKDFNQLIWWTYGTPLVKLIGGERLATRARARSPCRAGAGGEARRGVT